MSAQPAIPSQHTEHLSKALYALTIDPGKDILYYFAPFIGAWFAGYRPLIVDPSQEAMMPLESTKKIVKEIQDLTKAAKISRGVAPYIGLNHHFGSSGGRFSLSQPALLIPDQILFRRGNLPDFGSDPNYEGTPWIFSDNEIRFFIARELAQIKLNSSLLRIAIKVIVITTVIAVFSTPMSLVMANTLLITAIGTYILTERVFQQKSDKFALHILKEHGIENREQIAIRSLEKIRDQNLHFRETSALAKWYINRKGDNYLDFLNPSLSSRIQSLRTIS